MRIVLVGSMDVYTLEDEKGNIGVHITALHNTKVTIPGQKTVVLVDTDHDPDTKTLEQLGVYGTDPAGPLEPLNTAGKFVIEHFNHGVYTGIDWSQSGNSYGPRFSWSIKRSDGAIFGTLAEAEKMVTKIKEFKDPNWKRPGWIDGIVIFNLQRLPTLPRRRSAKIQS